MNGSNLGVNTVKQSCGRPCALILEQEEPIADFCRELAQQGVLVLQHDVAELVQATGGQNQSLRKRFKDGKPGRD